MNTDDFKEIKKLLSEPKRIVLITHKNADGDAVGSALGLYHYLKNEGHEAQVIVPDAYPGFLKWLPGTKEVLQFDWNRKKSKALIAESDLIFLLDFNELSRTGEDLKKVLVKYPGIFIMIDHHEQPDDVATYLFSNTKVCATAQMIYHFLENLNDTHKITPDIATCLYTGIMTDTGSFRFPNTDSTTLRIAAELVDAGADNARIYSNVYDVNSYDRLQLLGKALQNLRVLEEYRTAYITLTEKDKAEHNFKKGDTEGVVNYALSVKGVVFGVIFIEDQEQGIIKISFRSKGNFSVNEFARMHFSGGGHHNAAGGRCELDMKKTLDKFISLLPRYKNQLINAYHE